MTVYIEKPSVNLREELASLRNQGGYEERQFYFDNLVTNGTFGADTDWTKQAGWTISGGTATYAPDTGRELEQTITTTAGKAYVVTYDVTAWSVGAAGVYSPDSDQIVAAYEGVTVGTYSRTLIAKGATLRVTFRSQTTSSDFSIDNVSVYETDGTDVVHRMPKGWVPLHVYEDGLLQREGAANDYEVVYDGFDYFVKPAVAPSANTQTCVIGVRK